MRRTGSVKQGSSSKRLNQSQEPNTAYETTLYFCCLGHGRDDQSGRLLHCERDPGTKIFICDAGWIKAG